MTLNVLYYLFNYAEHPHSCPIDAFKHLRRIFGVVLVEFDDP